MKYSINNFQIDIINCIELCKKEVDKRKNGIYGESTLEQLDNIIFELEEIYINIIDNKIPAVEDRYLVSFANAFKVWGWDMEDPTELFILLTKINNNYKSIKK